MMEKRNVPAGVPAPARTGGERGEQISFSGFHFNTVKRFNQGISDLLGHGQSAAVPLAELVALTGMDGRTVRKMIERERRDGVPILADNRSGYFLPACDEETAACVSSLRHRAREILSTAAAIERVTLAEIDGQFTVDEGGRADE